MNYDFSCSSPKFRLRLDYAEIWQFPILKLSTSILLKPFNTETIPTAASGAIEIIKPGSNAYKITNDLFSKWLTNLTDCKILLSPGKLLILASGLVYICSIDFPDE